MTATVRRAGGFAAVGLLSLSVPYIASLTGPALATALAPGPFIVVAALALYVVDEGPVFELFARPGDRRDGRLYGLAGFALAAAGLALLAVRFGMPMSVFVGTVLLLSWGNLGGHAVRALNDEPIVATAGFVVVGSVAGALGQFAPTGVVAPTLVEPATLEWPLVAFLATSGALLAALLRVVLFERDDPLVMISVGLLLWLFFDLQVPVSTTGIAVALAVTVVLGVASYVLETASLPGMLTGVLLGLLTIVLGGTGWFVILMTFFGVGGLAAKFRYEEKKRRGIAEENEGARGSGNVLANSLAGLVAAIAFAMFDLVDPAGAAIILGAGVAGMTVDSILGATVEGQGLENEGVNFAATVSGALAAGGLAIAAGFAAV